eukprot:14881572-Ditylum_brightwellii.AAC.1
MTSINLKHNNFFDSGVHTGLTDAEHDVLSREGLITEEDFIDFKKTELETVFRNARAGMAVVSGIPAAVAVAGVVGVVAQADIPVVLANPGIRGTPIPANCLACFIVTPHAWNYYKDTDCDITSNAMHHQNTLHYFKVSYDALATQIEKDAPKIPTLSKINLPLKWCDHFKFVCGATFGVHEIPLIYVIRENSNVTPEVPAVTGGPLDPCITDSCFGSSGSVLQDLTHRSLHTHLLYQIENAEVFKMIEEATRTTVYDAMICSFCSTEDGRGAWKALVKKHEGHGKWDKIIKQSRHQHFALLNNASQHIQYQLPNEHTQVGWVLTNIEHPDPQFNAIIELVRQESYDAHDDFEEAVLVIVPYNLFKGSTKKGVSFEILDTTATTISNKFGRGTKTNVDLHWHKPNEFKLLLADEKDKLCACQQTSEEKEAIKKKRVQTKNPTHEKKYAATKLFKPL